MGYDISLAQAEKLERNTREGRRCAEATGRGGCFSRATVELDLETWTYVEDRVAGKPARIWTARFCRCHAERTIASCVLFADDKTSSNIGRVLARRSL